MGIVLDDIILLMLGEQNRVREIAKANPLNRFPLIIEGGETKPLSRANKWRKVLKLLTFSLAGNARSSTKKGRPMLAIGLSWSKLLPAMSVVSMPVFAMVMWLRAF